MPQFSYQAFDRQGRVQSGQLDANGIAEVQEYLKNRNLLPSHISKVQGGGNWWNLAYWQTSVDVKTKIQFTEQLSILLRAGVPLLETFNLLIEQFNGHFQRVLVDVRQSLQEGVPLATALEKYPKIFENFYIQLVRAGEASANLDVVLEKLTIFMQRNQATSDKISDAMQGPIFQMCMAMGLLVGACKFLIPSMSGLLSQMGSGELPELTQFMLDMTEFFGEYWLAVAALGGGGLFLFLQWKNSAQGKLSFDSMLLKLPGVAGFAKNRAVVQFAQTLGMLLEAGVNLPMALDIVSSIVDNSILSNTLKQARNNIIKEGKIAKHLKSTEIFSLVSSYMIKTGEESGNLAQMLIKVGNEAEISLLKATDNLVGLINPLLSILLAIIVILVGGAILLPVMNMASNINI